MHIVAVYMCFTGYNPSELEWYLGVHTVAKAQNEDICLDLHQL